METKCFFAQNSEQNKFAEKHLRLVVLFSPEMGGLVVRPMKSFPYKRDGFFALYKFMFYVYILFSRSKSVFYKGFSTDIEKRLDYHNSGKSTFTSMVADWELVYSKSFDIKREALQEEKRLKKLNKASLERLIKNDEP